MANTLTNLIPDVYAALDVVSRELVALANRATTDASAERAGINDNIRVPVSPAAAAEDITAAATPPDTGDQTWTNVVVQVTKSRAAPFRWTGDEQLSVDKGPGYENLRRMQIIQAMRKLTNEVESDLAGLYVAASRAHGTAGTTPLASDLGDIANARRIIVDNGGGGEEMHAVINTAAGVNLRKMVQLTSANQAGTDATLRAGDLLPISGVNISESAQIKAHTKGTSSGHLVNSGSLAVGSTTIPVDTGTGTILAGDVVTFAGDSNKYVVATALAGGSFTIAAPGLRTAVADDSAVTLAANYTANLAYARSAIVLAIRQPALPEEGDSAQDVLPIADPLSGITFELSRYGEYRRTRYMLGLAWGVKCIKPEHVALLLG